LRGDDAAAAYQAMRRFASRPEEAVAFFKKQFRPPPGAPDPDRVARLIHDLESDPFAERERAQVELQKLGARAEPALLKAREGQLPAEVRRRVAGLLERLEGSADPTERLRWLRAIEVLEDIGSPEGKKVLQALSAGGWGTRVAREAKVSLQRLARRTAAKP
jgi:hypothetical protein